MNPFDPDFKSHLVAEMCSPRGHQALQASRRASARIEEMRASEDPRKRLAASGTIPGIGRTAEADKTKTSRIKKPAKF
ncbi:MAG: hypothetical protein DI603_15215 [Roseateles depolymerans]|uniref:Uncharacterized protein n=1 Tax=Roseateles depolymerans TaxID=76731 RepID=A0A2W5DEZ1_9BURK|nr:MAG: hypothetical protein DI603_15215 [Roseateles depolymerans]